MRTAILATIMLASAFSGCLADPAEPQTVTDSSEPAATTSTTGTNATTPSSTNTGTTTSAAAAENTPPTANLTTDVPNGTAPLNVTFTVEGADEDGDELTWTLDIDSDGTAEYNGSVVPDALVHEFTEPGNYTAVLTVSDGTANATANVTVAVEVGAATGPKEDLWVRWDEAGMCHAKGAQAAGPLYVHDRPGAGDPPIAHFVLGAAGMGSGGGIWVYEESNGVAGLQVGTSAEDAAYQDCLNPDTLIF